ncbi:tetratricopeptide repeat protein [Amycolatopsis sp. NPDC059657]|uniref:tetratricopeptide repeat protein n=1 Tax=Amycolatopsis sp. NPDC059657 TaxID=3346899 RepID=UPI003672805A
MTVTLLRDLVPRIHREHPDLTAKHRHAILALTPDLADLVGPVPVTLTAGALWEERTRFQDGIGRRAAHGVAELLAAYAERTGPVTLTIDPADSELRAILQRRAKSVTIHYGPSAAPEEPTVDAVGDRIERGDFAAAATLAERATPDSSHDYRRIRMLHAFSVRKTNPVLAEEILLELQENAADPNVLLGTHYSLAMLYATFHEPGRRDLRHAEALVRKAVKLADELGEAFPRSFQRNALALLMLRMGRPEDALELTSEAIRILEAELPDSAREHRAVVYLNRARVLQTLGRLDEAWQGFTAAIAHDPYFPEYHYYRAGCARQRGDDEVAVAGYEQAMALSAPWPEPYYSRGDIRAARGDIEGALADFGYVLELDPDHLDALVNRAALLVETGGHEAAAADVEHGLALDPGNAHLLCTKGLLADNDPAAARELFAEALERDPSLTPALVNTAILDYDEGDFAAAIEKLTQAIERTPEDSALWFNRGVALEAAGHREKAAENYRRALELPSADRAELLDKLDALAMGTTIA